MSGNLYCCDQDKCLFLSVLPSEGYEEITWSFKLTSGILKRDSSIPLTLFILKYLTPKCDFCIHDACLIVIHEASLTGTLKYSCSEKMETPFSVSSSRGLQGRPYLCSPRLSEHSSLLLCYFILP